MPKAIPVRVKYTEKRPFLGGCCDPRISIYANVDIALWRQINGKMARARAPWRALQLVAEHRTLTISVWFSAHGWAKGIDFVMFSQTYAQKMGWPGTHQVWLRPNNDRCAFGSEWWMCKMLVWNANMSNEPFQQIKCYQMCNLVLPLIVTTFGCNLKESG